MAKKISSKHYVSNPISHNQIVGLEITSECAPEEDLTCGGINPWLQDIYNKLCSILNPELELGCLNDGNLFEVLNQIIEKACLDTTVTPFEFNVNKVNLCLQSDWDCNSTDTCLVPTQCDPDLTLEELLQALVSRNLDLSNQVKENCDKIAAMETRLDQLTLQIDNLDCC